MIDKKLLEYCCSTFRMKVEMNAIRPHPIKGWMIMLHYSDGRYEHGSLDMMQYCLYCGKKVYDGELNYHVYGE